MGFVAECDRRIAAAHRRLEKTPEENNRTTALVRLACSLNRQAGARADDLFLQMREVGEIEGAYQAAMAEVEMLGSCWSPSIPWLRSDHIYLQQARRARWRSR